jgi:hypothetical protein
MTNRDVARSLFQMPRRLDHGAPLMAQNQRILPSPVRGLNSSNRLNHKKGPRLVVERPLHFGPDSRNDDVSQTESQSGVVADFRSDDSYIDSDDDMANFAQLRSEFESESFIE